MSTAAFPPWPAFTEEEADRIREVLLSGRVNYWTGEEGRRFEEEFAGRVGARHAIALANGTLALEVALRALGIGPGDEVVVTPRSFVASAACVVAVGARPVFADVDPDSQNLTAATIDAVRTARTRAVLCVHLAGLPCEMDPIRALADRHGLFVVEDCAQAHGARYRGRSVGTLGHVAAWSFCQDKIMTTGGEGGMVTTDDPALWRRAWSLKDHGKSWEAVHRDDHPPGFRWLHDAVGTNARMTELQAAIGRIQTRRLTAWVEARRRNAAMLAEGLRGVPGLRVPEVPSHTAHAWYRFYAFLRPEHLAPGWSRERILQAVQDRGVPCFSGSCPEIYLERAFADRGLVPPARLPVARALGETSLALLVHPGLEASHLSRTIEAVRAVLAEAVGRPPARVPSAGSSA
mgnify:CR=1 FL=1